MPALHGGSVAAGLRFAAVAGVASLFLWLAGRRAGGASRLAYAGLVILFPFALLTNSRALIGALGSPGWDVVRAGPAGPAPEREPARNLVILLFDEFDEHTAFHRRPADLHLPEFDRLRRAAWVADRAYPTTNATLTSVPALLSGQRVEPSARISGPSRLELSVAGQPHEWATLPTLFAATHGAGWKASVVGWYHPYCRVQGALVARCRNHSLYEEPAFRHYPVIFFHTILNSLPGSRLLGVAEPGGQPAWMRYAEQVRQYEAVHSDALRAIREIGSGVSLLYVHYPIPHHPYVFDRRTREYAMTGGYLDNLALADRTLAEIRAALEHVDLGRTALLVTSDHSNRLHGGVITKHGWADRDDPTDRVPLILFIPGGGDGAVHAEVVETTVVRDLALAVMNGEVADHSAASRLARRFDSVPPRLE